MKGLSECKASESNIRRIQVKDIVKEVEDYLKTYSSARMDISCEKGLIAESFDWDEESVSSEDEETIRIRAFIAIAEDEPSVGKADDQRKNLLNKFNLLKQELSLHKSELLPGNIVNVLGGKGRRKENNFSKEVVFTKADEYSSEPALEITSDSETDCDTQEPLPALPKLIGAEPSGTSNSLISLSDLTSNMAKLTLNNSSKRSKKSSVKVSQTYVIKKTEPKEVKGIKDHIKIPSVTSSSGSQASSSMPSKQKDYLKRSVWYLDSGCSRHMTGVKQYMHKYSKEPGPKVVFRDDSSGDTEGYDSVNCNGITFIRVAYMNGLKHNLINISQLCDANFKVLFTKTQGTIFNQKDKVILIAPRRRDVYIIDMSSFNKESNACFLAKASSRVNWLWHKRLSHLNFKNINNLAKHNLVSGLPSLTFSKDKNCSAYEYLRYSWVSCLKKSDTADCIMSFIRKMENLNEVRVNELRSDNGTEFRNHKLEEFCDEKGISQNFSSSYTPEQNRVAKRRNRTLIEAARTMLNIAKLPKQFWGEAVKTACFT
ncbi:retrovirus-related pol polyprotein from transposon TNT 1-94 [Tanacetum coccineum]